MKTIFILFFFVTILALFTSCKMCKTAYIETYFFFDNMKKNPYATIDFVDFFKDDTVSFYLNDSCIFYDQILNCPDGHSREISNFYQFEIIKKKKSYTLISSNKKKSLSQKITMPKRKSLLIRTKINGFDQFFEIDIRKKRYIAFPKYEDTIYMIQQRIPIEYM